MIPDINLLPKLEQENVSNKLFYILIGIIAGLALILLGWLYFTARGDIKDLEAEELTFQQQLTDVQTELTALEMSKTGTISESLAFVERISYPVSPLIDEINGLLPEHAYLRNYSFTESGVQINIDFESLSEISRYVERLNNSPFFEDVQLNELNGFEIVAGADSIKAEDLIDFNEAVRYSAMVSIVIDNLYLASGGAN